MGRRKLEMKRIEERSSRQVAFCKRRKGLINKAKQLSILCDVDVAVIIFSNRGNIHEFSSTNRPVKYSSMTTGELLQETERRLKETNADGLTVTDLIHLVNELQTAVMQIRSRKTHLMLESVKDLHEKEKLLHKEKKHLEKNRARMKKNTRQRVTFNFL